MSKLNFTDFTGLYKRSITLRFEAKPVGKTLENIEKNGVIEADNNLAKSASKMKLLIDECHKQFINEALKDGCNLKDKLQEFRGLSKINESSIGQADGSNGDVKKKDELMKYMREAISGKLTKSPGYLLAKGKENGKKKTIVDHVEKWLNDHEEEWSPSSTTEQLCGMNIDDARALVKQFKRFSTYFGDFNQNRKNMYSADAIATGIANRLINQNLPTFIDNMSAFSKIVAVDEMQANLDKLYDDMKEYLNVASISELFHLEAYDTLLTQSQIEVYNAIIGGKKEGDHEEKIKGINEYVNLYNQHHKDSKLPHLKRLYKQILSDREAISWLPQKFEGDNALLRAVRNCYDALTVGEDGKLSVIDDLKSLLQNIKNFNLSGIFISNGRFLSAVSNGAYGNWHEIEDAIRKQIADSGAVVRKKNWTDDVFNDEVGKVFKQKGGFCLSEIDNSVKSANPEQTGSVAGYFTSLGITEENGADVFTHLANAYAEVKILLETPYPKTKNLMQDEHATSAIKNLLDAIKEVQRFVEPLVAKAETDGMDYDFYGRLTSDVESLYSVTPLYNMVRNYLTGKPYSTEKVKLNFGNPALMNGWGSEDQYGATILRKGGVFFLAIMANTNGKLLKKEMPNDGVCYEKMVYSQLKIGQNAKRMFVDSGSAREEYGVTDDIVRICEEKSYNANPDDLYRLIDYYKRCIKKYSASGPLSFNFRETSDYKSLKDFFDGLDAYDVSFINVSESYINKLVDEGKMFLFQIYNKDFSRFSKGTPNMHTLYWRMLFEPQNLQKLVYKLDGKAELFFRRRSLEHDPKKPTHPANQPVRNKNVNNKKPTSLFSYDLIKDKRFTVDKFQFHVPITMNFNSKGRNNINGMVLEYLRDADDVHVIGIDRGERHLLYATVVDLNGNIKEQFTLNEIVNEHNGQTYKTNYHALLDAREKERTSERQDWRRIEGIKELKEGYVSQVVHKICELMKKYHAVVVLEDLNMGFKRGRQKVEKQVYQKFEQMLIDKLNYLVFKKADVNEPGGLLHALQLTSKFESFAKLGKQSGFLFYIPAWNTSKIDPVTGFVNLLDCRYTSVSAAIGFLSRFDSISYNAEKNWFEFKLDYDKFPKRGAGAKTKTSVSKKGDAPAPKVRKDWTICTHGMRLDQFRNPEKNSEWDTKAVDVTAEMRKLFTEAKIDISSGDLKAAILAQTGKPFFASLLHLLGLTLQMRNSRTGTEEDYLLSPVADANGNFYDSRNCGETLPKNADANGAYNIARKGLMMIEQLKKAKPEEDLSKLKFDLSNNRWLEFAQKDQNK